MSALSNSNKAWAALKISAILFNKEEELKTKAAEEAKDEKNLDSELKTAMAEYIESLDDREAYFKEELAALKEERETLERLLENETVEHVTEVVVDETVKVTNVVTKDLKQEDVEPVVHINQNLVEGIAKAMNATVKG